MQFHFFFWLSYLFSSKPLFLYLSIYVWELQRLAAWDGVPLFMRWVTCSCLGGDDKQSNNYIVFVQLFFCHIPILPLDCPIIIKTDFALLIRTLRVPLGESLVLWILVRKINLLLAIYSAMFLCSSVSGSSSWFHEPSMLHLLC